MPLNIPSGSTNNISFGPAKVYLGAAGSTPSTDVGFITEDGVTIEVSSERRDIMQGNPKLIEYTFSQTQGVMINFTSIEWNFDNFAAILGAGQTTSGGGSDTFSFGGDPITTSYALHIEHAMAVTGNTMNVYAWKVVAEAGLSAPLGSDEHQFPAAFKCQRVTTSWDGATLDYRSQLIKFVRATS